MLKNFINDAQQVQLFNHREIVVFSSDFNIAYYDDSFFKQHNIYFPSSLVNAVNKRKAEFFAGRYVAEKALRKLNVEDGFHKGDNHYTVAIGKHRSPVWPSQVIASISHSHNKAFCVAAKKSAYNHLGIDHENWLSDELVDQIKSSILVANENKLLQQIEMTPSEVFTLIFSIKESVFKALYPLVGRYFDFSAAEVGSINFQTNTVSITILETLSMKLPQGTILKGYFVSDKTSITTLVIG